MVLLIICLLDSKILIFLEDNKVYLRMKYEVSFSGIMLGKILETSNKIIDSNETFLLKLRYGVDNLFDKISTSMRTIITLAVLIFVATAFRIDNGI